MIQRLEVTTWGNAADTWNQEKGRERLQHLPIPGGYGDPLTTRPRLGQGTFRAVVTDLYERRCAITQEKALPAWRRLRFIPFHDLPEHEVTNGILLRSDVHRLFDAGYSLSHPSTTLLPADG